MVTKNGYGIVAAGLCPHPPIAVPEVGGADSAKVSDTFDALTLFARHIKGSEPDLVVVVGPHGPVLRDSMTSSADRVIRGDLGDFGAPQIGIEFPNDSDFARRVDSLSSESEYGTRVAMVRSDQMYKRRFGEGCDHGTLIPLLFIQQEGLSVPVTLFTVGMLSYTELYRFGMAIRDAAEQLCLRVAVIASGDLSHRLTPDAPNGYNPDAKRFDKTVLESVERVDPTALLRLDPSFVEDAAECGLRPIFVMLGTLDGLSAHAELLSYEGPFGVGYGVVSIKPGQKDDARKIFRIWRQESDDAMKRLRQNESPHTGLARAALEAFVKEGVRIPSDDAHETLLGSHFGVFVSLQKHGKLRGCIGSVGKNERTLAAEIVRNAISAGTEDPRFVAVTEEELDHIVYSVDVLSPMEEIESAAELDPEIYGVMVEKGRRSGLLLPDLEGIETVGDQLRLAMQKAGIRPDEGPKLYRFRVSRCR